MSSASGTTILASSSTLNNDRQTNGAPIAEWSNAALERRAAQMRADAEQRSAALTQQLATTLSGQNLLHMGQQLNHLIPPNLHALVSHLAPLSVEPLERALTTQLSQSTRAAELCRAAAARAQRAQQAIQLYQDLRGAEQGDDLERTALRALYLNECWRRVNDNPTQGVEYEAFVLRLGPRIRKLEVDTVHRLGRSLEETLMRYTKAQQQQQNEDEEETAASTPNKEESSHDDETIFTELGQVIRGLVLLGRAKDVETIFTNTAIRPILQTHLSLGRIDHGGARGECTGLPDVLQEVLQEIRRLYRPIWTRQALELGEIDFITHGIWVPLVAALMKDTALRMAIFAPGLAPVWHANYTTLVDQVMATLAQQMLQSNDNDNTFSAADVQRVQDRIDQHPMTVEFMKRWNLPIYYQLRFGECGTRLQRALEATQCTGWSYTMEVEAEEEILVLRERTGLQYPLFLELYATLLRLWRPDVWVRPLTHRFLRGAVQLLGRVVALCQEGLDGKLLFGTPPPSPSEQLPDGTTSPPIEESNDTNPSTTTTTTIPQYCWGDRENEVAAVLWELDCLESALLSDYTSIVCDTLLSSPNGSSQRLSPAESDELKTLVQEVLQEASELIHPVIDRGWNERIIPMLITKCAGPLGAVKGVAATYRMTNRPPPTLPSPFVATILRPVRELAATAQIPTRISWKEPIVATIAQRYAAAVADLLGTVQRAEESLSKRKGRTTRPSTAAMSDADKVKRQLFLDYEAFVDSVRALGDVDPSTLDGITQLAELTREGAVGK